MSTTDTTRKPRAKRKVQIQPPTTTHPFRDVMRAGVPLVQYETSDPAATIKTIVRVMNGEADTRPLLVWDILRGLVHLNEAGKVLAGKLVGTNGPQSLASPVALLKKLDAESGQLRAPNVDPTKAGAVIFMHNAHRFIDDVAVMQGVWNLRDRLKSVNAILVLLCTTGKTPLELQSDIIALCDPRPGPSEASEIIKRIGNDAVKAGATFDPEESAQDFRIVDAALGASGFGIEQSVAMSVRRDKIDLGALRQRQQKMIEQTRGLTVLDSPESLDDIAGHANVLEFLTGILSSGRTPVNAVFFLDELDKSLGAGGGDTSGTSQDQSATFLKVTQDYNIPALMLIGPGGTGKSLIAKACGKIADAITLAADLGACKGSLVGESEQNIRRMFEVAGAVSQWKMLIVATCNRIGSLTPEIRRRFKLGTYFVDVLSEAERAVCWKLKRKKFSIPDDDKTQPASDGWTGAEIEACCEIAYRSECTLGKAGQSIVPVSVSAREEVEALRRGASNRFLSASKPGLYEYTDLAPSVPEPKSGRSITFEKSSH